VKPFAILYLLDFKTFHFDNIEHLRLNITAADQLGVPYVALKFSCDTDGRVASAFGSFPGSRSVFIPFDPHGEEN